MTLVPNVDYTCMCSQMMNDSVCRYVLRCWIHIFVYVLKYNIYASLWPYFQMLNTRVCLFSRMLMGNQDLNGIPLKYLLGSKQTSLIRMYLCMHVCMSLSIYLYIYLSIYLSIYHNHMYSGYSLNLTFFQGWGIILKFIL